MARLEAMIASSAIGALDRPSLTVGEVAHVLRCSKGNVRKLSDRNEFRVDPDAKRIRYDPGRLRAYLSHHRPDALDALDRLLERHAYGAFAARFNARREAPGPS